MKRHLIHCILFICIFSPFVLAAQETYTVVATNNCGVEGAQPFLVKGGNYTYPNRYDAIPEAHTCNFGADLIYAFDNIDIHADYKMDLLFLADAARVIQLKADGNLVCEAITLPAGKEVRKTIQLPRKSYAYGQLVLVFEVLSGANAVVSEIKIASTNKQKLTPFSKEKKQALIKAQEYVVDTDVDVEAHLPRYTPNPSMVSDVSTPTISLNGTWEFSEKAGSEIWHPIQVPGQWSMQGFKVDSAGWASYKKSFDLPKDWAGKQVVVRFDGVHSEYVISLNGKEVGSHLGGMTAYEINLTPYLRKGSNELKLNVRSESLADMLGSLTQYAAHQLGGITRKVTLLALPNVHITDLRVVTDLDPTYTNATLKLFTSIQNYSPQTVKSVLLNVSLDNKITTFKHQVPAIESGKSWSGWLEIPVNNPLLWNNEQPNLYNLRVDLSTSGSLAETIKRSIGFREVEIRGNEMFINGASVKLRGVCRHESHPLSGRVLTTALQRKDIELYREGNCNFIRTSHYPPSEEFVALCDELGMFVEVEAPVCWIGHHANKNWKKLNYKDPSYYPYVLQANMETMHFYRNHASVILWSMANESYWNQEFAQVLEYMKKADPSRPYAFHDQAYGGFNNQGSTAPVANIHYPGPNGYKTAAKSDRPMLYGEYCHLNVYNRSELVTDPGVRSDWALALAPTWENMYNTKGVLGGSIWSGIDDIFQLPNGDAVGYGPWGPIDGWRRPKPEYWDMKKIYSPIQLITKKLTPANRFEIALENRYTYLNLSDLKISWRYGKEKGSVNCALAPGKKGSFVVEIKNPAAANELYIAFSDPRGFLVDEYLIPAGKQTQNELPDLKKRSTKLKQKKDVFVIKGSDFVCEIDRTNGQIKSLRKNDKELLSGGPWLMALPLNGGGCFPNHNANTPLFNDLCSEWEAATITATKVGDDVVVSVAGKYKEFEGDYTLTINANGELAVSYQFEALENVNPRQWGVVFDAPATFNTTFWRREGIWSVYPQDHISRPVGVASVQNSAVPAAMNPREEPTWSWSLDQNELGSNDFRSTRRNIWFAGLKSNDQTITVRSNGKQHWRSWFAKDKIQFLVADFTTAGNEMFLQSYYGRYRKPIKTGDTVTGKVVLRVE